jgi:hypothetical protein
VKIKGTCRRCGREFLVDQVLENGGRCPWDGAPFQADYAAILVEALREAQQAGNQLEEALERVADVHPDLILDKESVLSVLRENLDRLESAEAEEARAGGA